MNDKENSNIENMVKCWTELGWINEEFKKPLEMCIKGIYMQGLNEGKEKAIKQIEVYLENM